jgi:methyl-accepting chemotaxis protein/methyl-accepting chemotaxis protein-1 (serine sensor receptor)
VHSAQVWILVVLALAIVSGVGWTLRIVQGLNRQLRKTALDLSSGAAEVASAAAQVASSSQALAQGASEQAASLEETTASTQEITARTRRNAENSRSASDAISAMGSQVDEGNRNLDDMLTSMAEIKGSSNKVSNIIKTIDEIAFQTNILALNAAVEAARAGEAGLGFAVVADEVRNLAQRSAHAARETAALIEESVTKSGEGASKVEHVARIIRTITDSTGKVKALVDEVHQGSKEQIRGIEQIARAIVQMDQVTQSNAASAEESAAASQQLSAQAVGLQNVASVLGDLVGSNHSTPLRDEPQEA